VVHIGLHIIKIKTIYIISIVLEIFSHLEKLKYLVQDFDTYNCGHMCLAFLLSFVEDVESKPVYLNG